MTVRFAAAARADLHDRLLWYDQRRGGLGDQFHDAVAAAVRDIAANPRMYAPLDDAPAGAEVRAFWMKRFRHRIVYAVRPDGVLVLQIDRGRRGDQDWLDRLADEPTE
jgi:toxin ParE1/3/4